MKNKIVCLKLPTMKSLKRLIKKMIPALKEIRCSDKQLSDTQLTSSKHQQMVLNLLDGFGFIPVSKKYENTDLPNNLYYCSQPFGKQKAPDIMLINVVNGVKYCVKLELKKGAKKIMWNDGFPQQDTLYLFTDHKRCKTNLFCKQHLVTSEKMIEHQCKIIKQLNEECKKGIEDGFRFYTRKANSQVISDKLLELDTTNDVEKFLKIGLGYIRSNKIS